MSDDIRSQQILAVVRLIPKGFIASYGQIADLAGLPGRARQVGRVLKVADTQHLPWHRVILSSGRLAFPVDSDRWQEQRLRLIAEGVAVTNGKVNLHNHTWRPGLDDILLKLSF